MALRIQDQESGGSTPLEGDSENAATGLAVVQLAAILRNGGQIAMDVISHSSPVLASSRWASEMHISNSWGVIQHVEGCRRTSAIGCPETKGRWPWYILSGPVGHIRCHEKVNVGCPGAFVFVGWVADSVDVDVWCWCWKDKAATPKEGYIARIPTSLFMLQAKNSRRTSSSHIGEYLRRRDGGTIRAPSGPNRSPSRSEEGWR
ncbi:hypothetical protein MGYG_09141 [Nannizzia gypsea CBS 118893]|uniref:Uncharacterized protein n=1 Tax=Arthroderma gypseum (strain ATCC MYA-4604 / CBS 118893) TaxID=535722 RepID=E4V1E4_ARTGP|nr:hypothetical protein MGYG_09141 [Nannizzia gypsea CBS 118893]EFR03859.1 hypothetical protein MGYG_09141 [Nannizzia gypsea CBS 118893]